MKKLTLLLVIFIASFGAFADIHSFKKMTWNMQGAVEGSGDGNKWATSVRPMITNSGTGSLPDIIAIQEGGAGPGSYDRHGRFTGITGVARLPDPGSRQPNSTPAHLEGFDTGDPEIVEFEWNITGRGYSHTYYVYGVISDINQPSGTPGRVNSYLVSRQRADEVIVLAHRFQDSTTGIRPNFAIRQGNSYFFSIHSISGNAAAGDSAWRLNQIEEFVTRRGAQNDWAVMGDFNADPANVYTRMVTYPALNRSHPEAAYNANQPTQTSGGELDYMIFRDAPGASGGQIYANVFFAALMPILNSDHFPVRFWQ